MPSIAHRPPSPLYVGRPRRHRRQRGNSGAARSKVATPCGPRSSCGPCCPRGSKGRARRRRTLLRRRSGWPRSPRSAEDDRSPPDRARPRPCRSRNSSGTAAGLDAPPPPPPVDRSHPHAAISIQYAAISIQYAWGTRRSIPHGPCGAIPSLHTVHVCASGESRVG